MTVVEADLQNRFECFGKYMPVIDAVIQDDQLIIESAKVAKSCDGVVAVFIEDFTFQGEAVDYTYKLEARSYFRQFRGLVEASLTPADNMLRFDRFDRDKGFFMVVVLLDEHGEIVMPNGREVLLVSSYFYEDVLRQPNPKNTVDIEKEIESAIESMEYYDYGNGQAWLPGYTASEIWRRWLRISYWFPEWVGYAHDGYLWFEKHSFPVGTRVRFRYRYLGTVVRVNSTGYDSLIEYDILLDECIGLEEDMRRVTSFNDDSELTLVNPTSPSS